MRLDEAWHAVEPNLVGTDDFLDWARLAGVEPMLAVNLGTRGPEAAQALVEYCNGAPDTPEGARRAANGHREPHRVGVWCLGNEMDGPWQIGAKSAADYGRLAFETGAAMRIADPSIELVACGSSGAAMPTFGTWEETVLDLAWDMVDHISVHAYLDPSAYATVDAYLAAPSRLDDTLGTVAGIADRVGARRGSGKSIGLSVDEWNVWRLAEHQASELAVAGGPYRRSPALAEDQADVADALVVGGLLLALLRHADRVRIACVAQLVNVIPLIRTVDGGPAWLNTTAHPFADVARWARGGTVVRSMHRRSARDLGRGGDLGCGHRVSDTLRGQPLGATIGDRARRRGRRQRGRRLRGSHPDRIGRPGPPSLEHGGSTRAGCVAAGRTLDGDWAWACGGAPVATIVERRADQVAATTRSVKSPDAGSLRMSLCRPSGRISRLMTTWPS